MHQAKARSQLLCTEVFDLHLTGRKKARRFMLCGYSAIYISISLVKEGKQWLPPQAGRSPEATS